MKPIIIIISIAILTGCASKGELTRLTTQVTELKKQNDILKSSIIRLDERNRAVANQIKELNNGKKKNVKPNHSLHDEAIFNKVEISPSYPGGEKEMIAFFTKNLKRPKATEAFKGDITPIFIVEKDGTISNIQITKGGPNSYNNEIIRILKLMPNWIPGKIKGKIVRSRYKLPITL